MIQTSRRLASAILCAALFVFYPAYADGPLATVASFTGSDTQLDIQTFEQNGKKAGVIDVSAGPTHAAFLLDDATSEEMLDIWAKAKSRQAGSWSSVGTVTEGRANPSSIAVSAGFGVRLILHDPKLGSFTHVVTRDNMAAFEAALLKVRLFLKS